MPFVIFQRNLQNHVSVWRFDKLLVIKYREFKIFIYSTNIFTVKATTLKAWIKAAQLFGSCFWDQQWLQVLKNFLYLFLCWISFIQHLLFNANTLFRWELKTSSLTLSIYKHLILIATNSFDNAHSMKTTTFWSIILSNCNMIIKNNIIPAHNLVMPFDNSPPVACKGQLFMLTKNKCNRADDNGN